MAADGQVSLASLCAEGDVMPIISRTLWGAQYGRGRSGLVQRGEIVVHTEAGANLPADATLEQDCERVRDIERFHVETRGWTAIAYSFLVAPSGRAFEGRGWGRDGSHTQQGRNQTAYAICFLGHGDKWAATEAAWDAAQSVVIEGLRSGFITPDYVVTGHRNYAPKSCPGNLIYPLIGRLRGLSSAPKDWFTMATEADLRRIVREELDAWKVGATADDQAPVKNRVYGADVNSKDAVSLLQRVVRKLGA